MQGVRVGRNDPCPCGSGKKFKQCCLHRGTVASRFASRAGPPSSLLTYPSTRSVAQGAAPPRQETTHRIPVQAARAATDDGVKTPDPSTVDVLSVEVGLDYTYPEPFGMAEVSYILPAGRLVCLADSRRIFADQLVPGMRIVLQEKDIIATIVAVKLSHQPPDPPVQMSNGLWLSRVVGRIKHIANAVLDVTWPGTTVTGTPDHPFYSVSRQRWLPAEQLQVGEFLRTDDNLVAPVQEVSKRRFGRFEVFNVEVEHFHTYYVGKGGNGVLVHNGGCINTPKQVAGITGFTKHGLNQAITRGVKPAAILDALKNPLKVSGRIIDELGRPAVRYIGRQARVVVNPDTLEVVSVNPTSAQLRLRLLGQLGLPF